MLNYFFNKLGDEVKSCVTIVGLSGKNFFPLRKLKIELHHKNIKHLLRTGNSGDEWPIKIVKQSFSARLYDIVIHRSCIIPKKN